MLKKFKSWLIRDDAVAAIEFALVGMPFMIMLIGIIEVCLFFAAAVNLDGATNDAARMIRTGQVQASVNPVQTFEDELSAEVGGLINSSDLQFQVLPITGNSFSNAETMTPEFDASGNLLNSGPANFNPSGSADDVLVRVAYRYVFLTPFLGRIITGGTATQALLMSTIVVENEPYEFGD